MMRMASGLTLKSAIDTASKPAPMTKQMGRAISMSIRPTPIKESGDVAKERWQRLANLVDDDNVMTEADEELRRLGFSEENEDKELRRADSLAVAAQSPTMARP